jgi:hypothetical protein
MESTGTGGSRSSFSTVSPSYLKRGDGGGTCFLDKFNFSNMMTSFGFKSGSDCNTFGNNSSADSYCVGQTSGDSSPMTGYRKLDFDCVPTASWGIIASDPLTPPPATEAATPQFSEPGVSSFFSCWPQNLTQALTGGGWPYAGSGYQKRFSTMQQHAYYESPMCGLLGEELWQEQPLPAQYCDPQVLSDLASDIMVNLVCAQTRPTSRYRQAAETLAKSNLNPNAAVFTPKNSGTKAARPVESTPDVAVESLGGVSNQTQATSAFPCVAGSPPGCKISPTVDGCPGVDDCSTADAKPPNSLAASQDVAELLSQSRNECNRTSAEPVKSVLFPNGVRDHRLVANLFVEYRYWYP